MSPPWVSSSWQYASISCNFPVTLVTEPAHHPDLCSVCPTRGINAALGRPVLPMPAQLTRAQRLLQVAFTICDGTAGRALLPSLAGALWVRRLCPSPHPSLRPHHRAQHTQVSTSFLNCLIIKRHGTRLASSRLRALPNPGQSSSRMQLKTLVLTTSALRLNPITSPSNTHITRSYYHQLVILPSLIASPINGYHAYHLPPAFHSTCCLLFYHPFITPSSNMQAG